MNDSIRLIKERNRKIRIADFSEGGWVRVKHYESNAVFLDLEDDKGSALQALRVRTRPRAKRQNAERVQGRYPQFLSHAPFRDTSSVVSSPLNRCHVPATQGFLQSPNKRLPVLWLLRTLVERVSRQPGLPEPLPPEMLFTLPEQVPARPPHVKSRSQFLDSLSSSVSDLLSTGQGIVSTVSQPDVSQEFMTLMENKFTDNSSLVFYKQNLYEYVQGTAAAVFKGRLRAHLLFWIQIVAPPWVIETIRSGYVILFETIPPGVCLSNNRSTLEHGDFVSSAVSRSS